MKKTVRAFGSALAVTALAAFLTVLAPSRPTHAQVPTPIAINGASAAATAANTAGSQVNEALPTVMGVGGGLLAVGITWRFTRRFVR